MSEEVSLNVFDTFDQTYRQYNKSKQKELYGRKKTYKDVISKVKADVHHRPQYQDEDEDEETKEYADDDDISKRYTDGNDVVSKRYLDNFEVSEKPYKDDSGEQEVDEIDLIKKKIKQDSKTINHHHPNPKRYNDDFVVVTKPYKDEFREEVGPPSTGPVYNRNNAPEVQQLEKMLQEIKERKVDKEFSKDQFTEVLIDNLYSQIAFLKQEVVQLRSDAKPRDIRINVDDGGESSTSSDTSNNSDSPIPSSIETYLPPAHSKRLRLDDSSQHLDSDDSDKSNDIHPALLEAKEAKYPGAYMPLDKQFGDRDDNRNSIMNKKKRDDEMFIIGSTGDLFDEATALQKDPMLSEDEDVMVEHHSMFKADGVPRINQTWQSAVIFMIVMSFTILVCCLIPIILIPK